MGRYHQGLFKPKNPEKYKGNPTQIVYRSGWELRFMLWLDSHDSVKSWSSEEKVIPYFDPTTSRMRRYFPDFIVEFQDKDKHIKMVVIEIKPYSQTIKPTQTGTKRRFIKEALAYGKNVAKWTAAKEWANNKGWDFKVMTEKELGI